MRLDATKDATFAAWIDLPVYDTRTIEEFAEDGGWSVTGLDERRDGTLRPIRWPRGSSELAFVEIGELRPGDLFRLPPTMPTFERLDCSHKRTILMQTHGARDLTICETCGIDMAALSPLPPANRGSGLR